MDFDLNKLRKEVLNKVLTQEDIANAIDEKPYNLSRFLTGKTDSKNIAMKLLAYLKKSPDEYDVTNDKPEWPKDRIQTIG